MARKPIQFNVNPLLGGPSLSERTRAGSPYRLIPVKDIEPDVEQPRKSFDSESLSDLAASIREYGVLSPVLVRVSGPGTYRLIAGERRLKACKMLGLDSIPAIVDSESDAEGSSALAKQLVENLQRNDLLPLERATAIGELRERYSWSIREIARRLGTSKAFVQRSVEVLSLSDDLKAALNSGASESKVLLLAQVENRELRKELLGKLEDLTRAQLEEEIFNREAGQGSRKQYRRGTGNKKKGAGLDLSPEDRNIVDEIQRALGTKVHLQRSKDSKKQGRLVIEFYSNEDLDEIYRRLAS